MRSPGLYGLDRALLTTLLSGLVLPALLLATLGWFPTYSPP